MTPSQLFDRLERPFQLAPQRPRYAVLGLVLMGLVYFLPGFFTMAPMDRDEPRFAQATRQMLASHDFVAIRFMDEARNKKPVGIYWLQAASVEIASALGVEHAEQKIWVYRLPSLLGAISAILLTYWAALAFLTPTGAWYAALLFGASLLIGVESRLAKTDAVLCASVAAALGVMARLYLRKSHELALKWAMAFWAVMGVGILIKGPITPLAPFLSALILSWRERSLRWLAPLRPLKGVLLCLALVLPWFVMIMVTTHGAFLHDSLGADMMDKVAAGQEAHGAPFGTYMLVFLVIAWPLAPVLLMSVPSLWQLRHHAAVGFLGAWIIPMWLIFEAVPTKLPHYVLPLYPAIAIAAVLGFEHGFAQFGRWRQRIGVLFFIIPAALIVVGAGGAFYFHLPLGLAYFCAAPLMVWMMWRLYQALQRGDVNAMIVRACLLAAISYPLAYEGVMSADVFAPFRLSPRLAAAAEDVARAHPSCAHYQIVSSGYSEPSLVLLMAPDFNFMVGTQAGQFMAQGECRIAFVTQYNKADFLAQTAHISAVREMDHVQGINLNGGRKLDIALYLREKAAP